jgi:hypothetical protein
VETDQAAALFLKFENLCDYTSISPIAFMAYTVTNSLSWFLCKLSNYMLALARLLVKTLFCVHMVISVETSQFTDYSIIKEVV